MISKHKLAVIEASAKGYYVDDGGEVISPKGIVRKCKINKRGYKTFNIKVKGKCLIVLVHKLCAYKKYGYQPSYVMWALQNVPFFTLSDSQNKKLSEKYSEWKFYHTNECSKHRNFKEVHDDLEAYAWGGVLGAGYE